MLGDFAGSYGEVHGIDEFFKVAESIDYVKEQVRNRGLIIMDIPSIKDPPELYAIFENAQQTFGEGLGIWNLSGGVWVGRGNLERYEQLIGIEGQGDDRS